MKEEAFLFIDTENIRFYMEDFYWIFRSRIPHLSHVYAYLNSAKHTIHHKFYEELSHYFPVTIRNLATTPLKKNGLDIHMTMDIMNFVSSRSCFTTMIYIASNDSDFAVLCQRLASPPHLSFGRIFLHDRKPSSESHVVVHYLSELTTDDRIIARCFFHWKTGMLTLNRLKKTIRGMRGSRRLSFPLHNLPDYLNRNYFNVLRREKTTIITTKIFSIPE